MPDRPIPSVGAITTLVACLTLVAAFVVGVCIQPEPVTGHRLEGLVLDGSSVTSTVPLSSAGRPVEPIAARDVGGDDA